MAALILPHRYRSQARGPVVVDYSNPICAGLVSAYNMTSATLRTSADSTGQYNGRKSSAGKNPYTLHGYQNDGATEARLTYCAEGAVWDFDGTYATKAYNALHPKNWTGAVTFVIRVLLRSNTANQCLIGHFNDGLTPDYLYGCGLYVTGGTLYGVGANNNSQTVSTTAPNVGEWATIVCVANTTNGKLAVNGQIAATGNLSGASSGYDFAIGCSGHTAAGSTTGASFLNGLVGPALVFNRALSDAEIKSFSANPYQVLKPASNRLWLDVVAAGGSTASPSGVSTTASIGTATGSGAANTSPAGVAATVSIGTATASGGSTATATPSGVSAATSLGTAAATGAATTTPNGVNAPVSTGTAAATGSANATPAGGSATTSLGTAAASVSGAGTAYPTGVSATASMGTVTVSGAATATPSGRAATAFVGTATAAVITPTPGNAYPTGAMATASLGLVVATVSASIATGVRGVPIAAARTPVGSTTADRVNTNKNWWLER